MVCNAFRIVSRSSGPSGLTLFILCRLRVLQESFDSNTRARQWKITSLAREERDLQLL